MHDAWNALLKLAEMLGVDSELGKEMPKKNEELVSLVIENLPLLVRMLRQEKQADLKTKKRKS